MSFQELLLFLRLKLIDRLSRQYLIFIFFVFIQACDLIPTAATEEEVEQRKPVARVNNTYLYEDDLQSLLSGIGSSADSSMVTKKYIENWIKKQLTLEKANATLDYDQAAIERKVQDYRYALIVHEFEKYYINAELSKEVTEEEILEYYEEKKDNFLLKQNIVKCLFAKVPKEAPRMANFRREIRGYPDTDLEEIRSYAFRFAVKSHMEDSIWVNFDDVIQNTTLQGIPNKVQFLSNNEFVETADEEYIYFLKLLDYKISDQVSPLEFIRDDIKNIIINKRKVALKKALEEEIYEEAIQNESFEIYE